MIEPCNQQWGDRLEQLALEDGSSKRSSNSSAKRERHQCLYYNTETERCQIKQKNWTFCRHSERTLPFKQHSTWSRGKIDQGYSRIYEWLGSSRNCNHHQKKERTANSHSGYQKSRWPRPNLKYVSAATPKVTFGRVDKYEIEITTWEKIEQLTHTAFIKSAIDPDQVSDMCLRKLSSLKSRQT